jgi:hypothetical protein
MSLGSMEAPSSALSLISFAGSFWAILGVGFGRMWPREIFRVRIR